MLAVFFFSLTFIFDFVSMNRKHSIILWNYFFRKWSHCNWRKSSANHPSFPKRSTARPSPRFWCTEKTTNIRLKCVQLLSSACSATGSARSNRNFQKPRFKKKQTCLVGRIQSRWNRSCSFPSPLRLMTNTNTARGRTGLSGMEIRQRVQASRKTLLSTSIFKRSKKTSPISTNWSRMPN